MVVRLVLVNLNSMNDSYIAILCIYENFLTKTKSTHYGESSLQMVCCDCFVNLINVHVPCM